MKLYRLLPVLLVALSLLVLVSACGGKGGGGY
jgi:predicted small secreted protein